MPLLSCDVVWRLVCRQMTGVVTQRLVSAYTQEQASRMSWGAAFSFSLHLTPDDGALVCTSSVSTSARECLCASFGFVGISAIAAGDVSFPPLRVAMYKTCVYPGPNPFFTYLHMHQSVFFRPWIALKLPCTCPLSRRLALTVTLSADFFIVISSL